MASTAGSETTERLVAGRYRLQSRLGKGGMGTVWLAEDELLGRPVAVKEVAFPADLPERERNVLRKRTMREARLAARLDHPAAVTVFDVVQENGWPYIVMEFIRARTLTEVVRDDGRLTPQEAARVGLAVLGALEAAHRLGIVHRDVKPSNIMVGEDGRVTLTDFGIATSTTDSTITTTGLLLGSPSYMAPERVDGREPGPASDLWSLGATLYAVVEGRPPFERDEPLLTLAAIVQGQAAPFRDCGVLAPVIQRMLARDPADRPTAEELRTQLSGIAETPEAPAHEEPAAPEPEPEPVVESAPVVVMRPPVEEPPVEEPPRGYTPAQSSRRGPTLVLAAVLALALLGGAAWLFSTANRRGEASPGTSPEESVAAQPPTEPETEAATEPQPEPTTEAQTEAPEQPTPTPTPTAAAVPADWVAYTRPDVGWTVSHPPGWEVVQRDGTRTDIRDPGTGRYLRVDYRSPPGPSALGAWQEFEDSFASRVGNYQQIRMENVPYRNWETADWEYTFTDGGATLHAINRGFITGTDYAFGLNFVTREEDWEESRALFDQFAASFQRP